MNKETKKLLIFFLATFVWTWACYGLILAGGHNPYQMPWMILLILGGMGPSLVGVVMVLLSRDREARRDYWRRCFSFKRIGGAWWAVIFLVFPLLYGFSILVDVALGGSPPGMTLLKDLIANPSMIPLAAFISFMSGPWSEEFGWRGYAEDRILAPLGILTGTVVLGLVWGVWHLPLFFMPDTWHGQIGFGLSGFWMFMLHSVGLSLLMTWVYLNTNRSILSAMFMHFTSNFTSQLLAPVSSQVDVIKSVLMFVIGIAVCLFLSHRGQTNLQMDTPKVEASR